MRYQLLSFRRGGETWSLAMKIHRFKGLIYFLYSAILVLGAFLQHIRSLQTPVSLRLIYNNITICSSFHRLHQVMKLNYQVRKKWKSQNNDVEQVSGCQWSCHSYCCVKLKLFRNSERWEQPVPSQPTPGSAGQCHLYRIYPGKRPQVQPVFPLPPYFTLNNIVDVIQCLHIEDFLPLKISILLYCVVKCQYIRIHYRTKQNQYNTHI